MTSNLVIEPAAAADLSGVLALLKAAKLPSDGIEAHLGSALVIRERGAVVGSAALELYGDSALLRSVAVDASLRGTGWGIALTEGALRLARERGVRAVYLLTETASAFFPRFGFAAIDRAEVPVSVKSSIEFTKACPSTAVAMCATDFGMR